MHIYNLSELHTHLYTDGAECRILSGIYAGDGC